MIHTAIHYYLEFLHGNPAGFVFLHVIAFLIIAVIVHEKILDDEHEHIFDPVMSLQCRDEAGNITHLLCAHPSLSRVGEDRWAQWLRKK